MSGNGVSVIAEILDILILLIKKKIITRLFIPFCEKKSFAALCFECVSPFFTHPNFYFPHLFISKKQVYFIL